MNIKSKVLFEAIEFVDKNEKIRDWIERRDKSERVSAKSLKSELINISHEHKKLFIRIYIDFLERVENVKLEDIVIDLNWSKDKGFKIENVRSVPEV